MHSTPTFDLRVGLYPIHLTLCSDVTRAWRFCAGVFIHAIKVEFRLACVNTAPIIDLIAYVTADLDE